MHSFGHHNLLRPFFPCFLLLFSDVRRRFEKCLHKWEKRRGGREEGGISAEWKNVASQLRSVWREKLTPFTEVKASDMEAKAAFCWIKTPQKKRKAKKPSCRCRGWNGDCGGFRSRPGHLSPAPTGSPSATGLFQPGPSLLGLESREELHVCCHRHRHFPWARILWSDVQGSAQGGKSDRIMGLLGGISWLLWTVFILFSYSDEYESTNFEKKKNINEINESSSDIQHWDYFRLDLRLEIISRIRLGVSLQARIPAIKHMSHMWGDYILLFSEI